VVSGSISCRGILLSDGCTFVAAGDVRAAGAPARHFPRVGAATGLPTPTRVRFCAEHLWEGGAAGVRLRIM